MVARGIRRALPRKWPCSHTAAVLRANRVFGGPNIGDLASPAALAAALRQYKAVTSQLTEQLDEMRAVHALAESRFKDLLAQHHAAWTADRAREALRHADEIARLRDTHAAQLERLALRQPEIYGVAAAEAVQAAEDARESAQAMASEV